MAAKKTETVNKVKETAKETAKAVEKAVKTAAPAAKKAATTATKKTAEAVKKTAAKASAAKVKEEVVLEFAGKSVNMADVVENVKKAYKAEGNKAAIKKLQVYVKPEEGVAYYVINDVAEGKKVEL